MALFCAGTKIQKPPPDMVPPIQIERGEIAFVTSRCVVQSSARYAAIGEVSEITVLL